MGARTDQAAYWDAAAAGYAAQRAPSAVDAATLAMAPPVGDVLELGAGPGVVTRQILAHALAERVIATDVSSIFHLYLSTLAAEDPRLSVVRAEHGALAFPDTSFDVIYAMATLHHVRVGERGPLLAAIARWLRPGGRFALVEDWAFEPGDEGERRLCALRAALRAEEDPEELHWSEAAWTEACARAGLRRVDGRRVRRAEHVHRYERLEDPTSRQHLDWLQAHGPHAEIPMSILVFTR